MFPGGSGATDDEKAAGVYSQFIGQKPAARMIRMDNIPFETACHLHITCGNTHCPKSIRILLVLDKGMPDFTE